jgi:hypothetical protein
MKWQTAANNYFKHHETLNDENRAWLKAKVALDCKTLLDDMTREQIIQVAQDPKDHGFSAARLVRTLIWQTLARILCGDDEATGGNIRSFWYAYVDPLFTKAQLYKEVANDPSFVQYARALTDHFPYNRFSPAELVKEIAFTKNYTLDLNEDCIRDFVINKIFKYQGPFMFADLTAQYKLVGTHQASLVLVCEKAGLWKFISKYHLLYGITIMCSQGNPSWVSIEYLAEQLEAKGIKNIHLATANDWDPNGFGIADDYAHKFETFGFKLKDRTMLTRLDLFLKDDLEQKAEDLTHLTGGKKTEAEAWFLKTQGINGRKAGIHIDQAVKDRIDKVVKHWVDANAKKDDEAEPAEQPPTEP